MNNYQRKHRFDDEIEEPGLRAVEENEIRIINQELDTRYYENEAQLVLMEAPVMRG